MARFSDCGVAGAHFQNSCMFFATAVQKESHLEDSISLQGEAINGIKNFDKRRKARESSMKKTLVLCIC